MASSPQLYDELMALNDIVGLSNDALIERIAKLIDVSGDFDRDEGVARALEWADMAEGRQLTQGESTLLEYFRANAWAYRRSRKHRDGSRSLEWDQPELEKEIWHLRRAITSPGFESLPAVRRCQFFTNLGIALSAIGRIFEAIEFWGRAIQIDSRFAMALGNRGIGLEACARSLYDPGHSAVYLWFAHKDFSDALSVEAKYENPHYELAKESFQRSIADIEGSVDVAKIKMLFSLDDHSLGASPEEIRYRQWCLDYRLFLNPLNDLGPHPIASRDILSLPNLVTAIGEPPTIVGFYSQIKQEFVSARWMLYDGLCNSGAHFSDRDVLLYNTLDYPVYTLSLEKVKAAFRIAYSILDKLAFLLNDYLRLGIVPNRVAFRTVWCETSDKRGCVLRKQFMRAENWALRGLYWLSKDFFGDSVQDVMEPDAQALSSIRNCVEHRYLKVHEFSVDSGAATAQGVLDESLAYSVGRRELEEKALRLLKLVRGFVPLPVEIPNGGSGGGLTCLA